MHDLVHDMLVLFMFFLMAGGGGGENLASLAVRQVKKKCFIQDIPVVRIPG